MSVLVGEKLLVAGGDVVGGFGEGLAGGGFGEDAKGGDGFFDEGFGFGAGVGDGFAGGEELADALDAVVFLGFEEADEEVAVLGSGVFQEVDHGEGEFAFFDIGAEGFADGFLLAADVEDVVDDLEGEAELFAVESEGVELGLLLGGKHSAEAAAGFGEGGGFAVDDEVVGFFVEGPVAAVEVLGELAFANNIRGVGDEAAGELALIGLEAGAEVVGVGDEVIAEEDGGFVAVEIVDGGAAAADFGAVEDVVMDEGGHVDHFDDGGEGDVGVGEGLFVGGVSRGEAGEEDEHGAEHFAAELADVGNEGVDVGEIGGEFFGEEFVNGEELRGDEIREGGCDSGHGGGFLVMKARREAAKKSRRRRLQLLLKL
jgi:hypothetical protein